MNKSRRKPRSIEHKTQCDLMTWVGYNKHRFPELGLLFAIPNGGHRNIIVATKLKREGVKPGIPDLCLPMGDGEHCALYIEMKRPKGKPTKIQSGVHVKLRQYGNKVVICDSLTSAAQELINYIVKRRKHVISD